MNTPRTNNRLKLARIERGLTQAELADLVDVTRQTIGLIEGGGYKFSEELDPSAFISGAANS